MSATDDESRRVVLVGNFAPEHVGHHLMEAAMELGLEAKGIDVSDAYRGSAVRRRVGWHLLGHRPPRLGAFGWKVVQACRAWQPRWVLSTGLAPLPASALEAIRETGAVLLNYLTDDPWNPAHRAPWFLQALPCYDQVFSPRLTNLEDLTAAGCRSVSYLPFAYAPSLHFPEEPRSEDERRRLACGVLFVGGADRDRIPLMRALIANGIDVGLYGGYWERYRETRAWARGMLSGDQVRRAVAASKLSVALVRRMNRDGHAMRSYELPAMGACLMAEDTEDHRLLYGTDGAVAYFSTPGQLAEQVGRLLEDPARRTAMASRARARVVGGANTYADRLVAMLQLQQMRRGPES
jgi:spore maturation protein CgeB